MNKSKNDIAWEQIFEKYHILDKLANHERVSISSTDINSYREARLMTKFYQLPEAHTKSEDLKLSVILTKMILK